MNKERVLDEMARQGVDVLLLGREGNARYVSGARRLFLASERAFAPGCVVVRSTREVQALSNTDLGIPNAGLYATSWNPATVVARVLGIPGVAEAKTIGVDGLTPLFESLLPDVELVDGEAIMRVARRIKTPDEIELLRAAAEVANAVMAAALEAAASGGAVRAIAMETMAAHGVTTAAFEPLVVRGAVAIGVLREGWEADVTRSTTALPNPAIERCRPATPVAGLPPDTHGIGLGYEVLAPDDILEPGMVLSVGVDGTRDTVLVTSGEPEVLTTPSGFG